MGDRITVEKEIYARTPRDGTSLYIRSYYTGKGLKRAEESVTEEKSDVYLNKMTRYSLDNKKTWGPWTASEEREEKREKYNVLKYELARTFDPYSGKMIRTMMYRLVLHELDRGLSIDGTGYFDQVFYQVSDDGDKWSEIRHLRYQDGPVLNDDNLYTQKDLEKNRMYGGYNMIPLKDGTILYSATVPVRFQNRQGQWETVDGTVFLKGAWKRDSQDYEWRVYGPLAVDSTVSSRGLMEPFLAELEDGRILVEMRGSNTKTTPGRKWISVSGDGGVTWSDVTDFRFDSGEQFYAPSALAQMIRSTRTGSLYWIGNICAAPPEGNLPRYPLFIAKVKEDVPALEKQSLTIIDDYDPEKDTKLLQLSNFCILENRETLDIELYMTRLGERGNGRSYNGDFWTADCYLYNIKFDH